MIGQKSFSNQTKPGGTFADNSNSPEAITSSGNVPAVPTKPQNPANKKLIYIILGIIAVIAIGVSVYFLVIKKASDPKSTTQITEGVSASGTNASTDIQKQLDSKIAQSSSSQEVLDAKFSKASFMIMDEDYDSALGVLSEISPSTISDYDQYRLYNYYTTIYRSIGNESEAERYQKLADEAHKRDLDSYKPE